MPDESDPALDLVLGWHMHQPDYRNLDTGEFTLPWVYLHAIKDYTDMAWHLERNEKVRAVVNLVPVLLDQLEDYAAQFATGRVSDPLLALLARDESHPLTPAERSLAIQRCIPANREKMVRPFAAYAELVRLFEAVDSADGDSLPYLSDRYFHDLVTWYHLAWTGESVRREHPLVLNLIRKANGFSAQDRAALFQLIGQLIRDLLPRYARLAAGGRIELSTTPHHHPLAPLLLDLTSAREVHADLPLPHATAYPGGATRVRWHLQSAYESHARRFGAAPAGVWPAEGAISDALLELLAEQGSAWTASSEAVLRNSLRHGGAMEAQGSPHRSDWLYRPYRTRSGTTCFFRDDRLSDLIGFEYSKWHSDEAAAHLVAELESIAAGAAGGERPLVTIFLDGENCWEYYPYNGFYFLHALYRHLASHPTIRMRTFADVARDAARELKTLPRVCAGSWVHGDFTTWIGERDKNRAWDLLCAAKLEFDRVAARGTLDAPRLARAARQLSACEASDWFWWLGGYNPPPAVASFESLFRANLGRLYALLGSELPAALAEPISRGSGHPEAGGTMRRST